MFGGVQGMHRCKLDLIKSVFIVFIFTIFQIVPTHSLFASENFFDEVMKRIERGESKNIEASPEGFSGITSESVDKIEDWEKRKEGFLKKDPDLPLKGARGGGETKEAQLPQEGQDVIINPAEVPENIQEFINNQNKEDRWDIEPIIALVDDTYYVFWDELDREYYNRTKEGSFIRMMQAFDRDGVAVSSESQVVAKWSPFFDPGCYLHWTGYDEMTETSSYQLLNGEYLFLKSEYDWNAGGEIRVVFDDEGREIWRSNLRDHFSNLSYATSLPNGNIAIFWNENVRHEDGLGYEGSRLQMRIVTEDGVVDHTLATSDRENNRTLNRLQNVTVLPDGNIAVFTKEQYYGDTWYPQEDSINMQVFSEDGNSLFQHEIVNANPYFAAVQHIVMLPDGNIAVFYGDSTDAYSFRSGVEILDRNGFSRTAIAGSEIVPSGGIAQIEYEPIEPWSLYLSDELSDSYSFSRGLETDSTTALFDIGDFEFEELSFTEFENFFYDFDELDMDLSLLDIFSGLRRNLVLNNIEFFIVILQEKGDLTDLEGNVLEAAQGVIMDNLYIDDETMQSFQEAVHLVLIAENMKGLLEGVDFGAITQALSDLVSEQKSLYSEHLVLTESIYKQLEGILMLNLDDEVLPDRYLKLNLSPQAKRKILIDLALRKLETKDKKDLKENEIRALQFAANALSPLQGRYKEELKRILSKFIFNIKKNLADVKPASTVEEEDKFKALFHLKK